MKILAFGASSSKNSINKALAMYTANQVANADVEVIDLNDYELPIFSEDKEKEIGQPELAQLLFDKIGASDAVVVSFAEHNGSYTAAYKNIFDWMSRINMQVYQGKPVLMLATSPGPGGASSVLAAATGSAPYFAADVKAKLSVASFYDHFDLSTGQPKTTDLADNLASVAAQLTL